jgi:hypothetical protein
MISGKYFLAFWRTGTVLASPIQTFADDDSNNRAGGPTSSQDLALPQQAPEADAAP